LKYDSIILSGSTHSVNNIPAQIKTFKEILGKALVKSHKLKILGICFGHQLIANIQGS
jgi:GMP synthase-like glutamine amidotransferase